jgi:hypothetical protein
VAPYSFKGTFAARQIGVGRRSRRAGVPLYAIVGRDALPHGARGAVGVADVLEARTLAELEAASAAVGVRALALRPHRRLLEARTVFETL